MIKLMDLYNENVIGNGFGVNDKMIDSWGASAIQYLSYFSAFYLLIC